MLRVLRTIRAHRNVLDNFIARDLKVKYRGTVFGYLWSLLEPLSLVAIYYFVFEVVASVSVKAYPLIVVLGVLPYNYAAGIITGGANALVSNAGLIRRVALPRETYVLAQVGSQTIVYFLSMLVVVPFLVMYDVVPGMDFPLFFVGTGLICVFATGIALIAACANVVLRDVGYVLRVLIRIFFYGSPVVYPVAKLADKPEILFWYCFNPMAPFLSLIRKSILGGPIAVPTLHLWVAVVVAVASFVIGSVVFFAWEKRAVKFL